MYELFTDRARKVMMLANQEAQRCNHEYIGTEHILLGLVKEGSGVAAHVLHSIGVDLHKLRLEVEKLTKSGPEMVNFGKLPQTPRAKKVIEYAMEEARGLQHNYVGTEHILLGLLRESEGVASQALAACGLTADALRLDVLNMLGLPVKQLVDALGDLVQPKPEEVAAVPDEVFPLTIEEKVTVIADRSGKFAIDQLEKAGIKLDAHVIIVPNGYWVEVRSPQGARVKETFVARAQ